MFFCILSNCYISVLKLRLYFIWKLQMQKLSIPFNMKNLKNMRMIPMIIKIQCNVAKQLSLFCPEGTWLTLSSLSVHLTYGQWAYAIVIHINIKILIWDVDEYQNKWSTSCMHKALLKLSDIYITLHYIWILFNHPIWLQLIAYAPHVQLKSICN